MPNIVAISGSLRKNSYNLALLRAAAALAPEGVNIEIATLDGIPLYNGDYEDKNGIPPAVADLKKRIAESDGVILATPEYNHSIPGVLKNAIDWCSRPPRDSAKIFGDRPFAVIGASTGIVGTRLSQAAWLPVLRALGTRTWFGRLFFLSNAGDAFDEDGLLKDEKTRKLLADFVAGFAAFAKR